MDLAFAVEAILGLEREDGRLRIAPCLPAAGGAIRRRSAPTAEALHVQVEDPDGVGRGALELELDSARLSDPVVALPTDGAEHRLRVRLLRPAGTSG